MENTFEPQKILKEKNIFNKAFFIQVGKSKMTTPGNKHGIKKHNMKKYFIQKTPFIVPTTDGKLIEEHHGIATTNNPEISIAHMVAAPKWSEPFQTPEFEEYTYIIKGKKQFNIEGEIVILETGQSIKIEKNTRVQYSNPFDEPCEYIAICKPAFDFTKVHREED